MPAQLTIELVPKTAWFCSVRSEVSKREWDALRRESYKKANYRCEICGGVGKRHPVECHEIWQYDDTKYIQKLVGLIALCPACHEVKHMGLAQIRGRSGFAKKHLAKVNGWTKQKTEEYVKKQFAVWTERSSYEWVIDLTWLDERDIKLIAK